MIIRKIYTFKKQQKDEVFTALLHIRKQGHLIDFLIYVDEYDDSVVITATDKAWEKWMLSPCYPDSLSCLISKLEFWQSIAYPS